MLAALLGLVLLLNLGLVSGYGYYDEWDFYRDYYGVNKYYDRDFGFTRSDERRFERYGYDAFTCDRRICDYYGCYTVKKICVVPDYDDGYYDYRYGISFYPRNNYWY